MVLPDSKSEYDIMMGNDDLKKILYIGGGTILKVRGRITRSEHKSLAMLVVNECVKHGDFEGTVMNHV